jgi:putative SOS response-associated peptidase YedK
MCGRYSLTATPEDVRALFGYIDQPNFPERYNIAPTQPVATVLQAHGARRFQLVRWGLIPSWVKDPASFTLLINARSETAAEKPSFRSAMKHRRCLFPASGFYEWRRTQEGKQPFYITPADGGLMAFAGLWETWCDPDGGDMDTGAMLTTQSNRMMAEIHHRMPVILKPDAFEAWLDTGNVPVRDVKQLMLPIEDDYLKAVPVSFRVNKVVNDDPDLLTPVTLQSGREAKERNTKKSADRKGGGSRQMDLF